MTYEQLLSAVHSALRFGIRPGLARIGRLLFLLGDPQDTLRCVHVAGTSGKGSTSAAIASALNAAGYRTGLTVSPYLVDFRERIQVGGEPIGKETLLRAGERVLSAAERMAKEGEAPTEFELVTAMAFECFRSRQCDVAVLEVGLGGRFDATNIIKTPLVSVITPISYDHTDILGDTLAKIAFEKCGIIKEGGCTVSAPHQPPEALETILRCCAQRGNTLFLPGDSPVRLLEETLSGTVVEYAGERMRIPLPGRHQVQNFLTARQVLEVLRSRHGFSLSKEDILRGFARVRMPGRFELLGRRPAVILDVAHNPAKLSATRDTFARLLPGLRPVVIMGMLADKDYESAIGLIAPLCSAFFALTPQSPRALPAEKTAEAARKWCQNVFCLGDYAQTCRQALSLAGQDGAVLACGSFYLAGALRPLLLSDIM